MFPLPILPLVKAVGVGGIAIVFSSRRALRRRRALCPVPPVSAVRPLYPLRRVAKAAAEAAAEATEAVAFEPTQQWQCPDCLRLMAPSSSACPHCGEMTLPPT
jgi:hypothetical protein